jgi:predicted nucleic acid-binding protein
MPEAVVVNASPLVFLGNAGRMDLLRAIGAVRVIVPHAVLAEVTATQHTDLAARSVAEAGWIERAAPSPIPAEVTEWDLGPGESAVIATALATPGARAIIDDLSGRRCALAVGLEVMGTLGVVIAAHRLGHVADPRAVLLDLRAHGMWLADAVIGRALLMAGVKR